MEKIKMMPDSVINVVLAGIGGQGVLKASDILSDAAFRAGYDVKKSEIHGMSQRGGSVSSDVRFGPEVFSPMVPPGCADFLVVLEETQVEPNRHRLHPEGVLIELSFLDKVKISNRKSLNVALLGVLSGYLDIDISFWLEAIRAGLPENLHEVNLTSFEIGRQAIGSMTRAD